MIVVTYEPTLSVELDAQTLVVPDLSEEDTYQVALAILHSSELGPRLKKILWERTSGRPLFIEALLRKLLQEGYIDQAEGYAELKSRCRCRNAARRRARTGDQPPGQLQPAGADSAARGGGAGGRFHGRRAEAVGEIDNRVQLRALLADLCKAQMLEQMSEDVYRFRHGLTQSVIYESLSRAQRLKLHRLAVRYWREHREVSVSADRAGLSSDEMRPAARSD